MNILFINSNLHGHINPTLALVNKLTERGNQVSYYCSEAFLEHVTKVGAKWVGFSNKLEEFLKVYRPTDKHPFFMLLEYILSYDEVVLPEIIDLVNKESYDLILCDSIFGGASFLKQITKIPLVCSHSSFAMSKAPVPSRMLIEGFHPQLDHCYQIVRRICKNYNIEEPTIEQIFTSKGDLNIVYTTKNFNGDDGVCEPDYLFIGPSIERLENEYEFDTTLVDDRKLIYISLGSLNTDFIDFYKSCISAFGDTDYYVCMSIGRKCEVAQLGEIPANFLVKNYLPQLEILKHADLFITHAGFNSVNEALYYGVPMLALPQVNDQHMVAKRLASMKLGSIENRKELSPEILRDRVNTMIVDKELKENCIKISQEMKENNKLEEVVIKLEKYLDTWKGSDWNGLKE